jgi:hypothetical protein
MCDQKPQAEQDRLWRETEGALAALAARAPAARPASAIGAAKPAAVRRAATWPQGPGGVVTGAGGAAGGAAAAAAATAAAGEKGAPPAAAPAAGAAPASGGAASRGGPPALGSQDKKQLEKFLKGVGARPRPYSCNGRGASS